MPAQSPTLSPTLSAITAGVARVVLGDAGLDLADQVGADVGALGEDELRWQTVMMRCLTRREIRPHCSRTSFIARRLHQRR